MNENEILILWKNYKRTNNRELRNKLIEHYAPLVKLIAGKLMIRVGEHAEYDDLCSIGIFGLIDAIEKFDLSKNIKFETYASLRIRGSILDELRKLDLVSRTTRETYKSYEKAKHDLFIKYGRNPTDDEIKAFMNLTDEEYHKFILDLPFTNLVSLDEHIEMGIQINETIFQKNVFETPEQTINKEELKNTLQEALNLLTEREKQIILCIYYEDLTAKEISKTLDISESRVSQIHSKALAKLRNHIDLYSVY